MSKLAGLLMLSLLIINLTQSCFSMEYPHSFLPKATQTAAKTVQAVTKLTAESDSKLLTEGLNFIADRGTHSGESLVVVLITVSILCYFFSK